MLNHGDAPAAAAEHAPARWPFHVAVAVALALALRLLHLWLIIDQDPLLIEPVVDAEAYHQWAIEILADPVGKEVFFQSPLYPYWVAAIYGVLGVSWSLVAVVQAFLGALSALMAALVTRRLAPSTPAAAVIAAWLMALYQPLIYYDALLLKVELTNFAVLVTLWALLRGRGSVRWLFASGVALGLLGLLRGNFYLALPMLLVWALLTGEGVGGQRWRHGAVRAVVFLCGFGLIVALVSVRNKAVADQWVFSSAGSGAVLYIGNNPNSPLGDYDHMPFVRTNPRYEEIDFRREAERRAGRVMTTAEASDYRRGEAIRYSLDNPGTTAQRVLHKTGLILESYELGDNYSPRFFAEFSPLGSPTLPWWALILSLAAAWLAFHRRDWAQAMPVLLMAAAYIASLLIFFVRSRYRIPLVPCLLVLAALEAALLWRWCTQFMGWGRTQRVALPRPDRRIVASHLGVVALVCAISLGLGIPRAQGENLGGWWGRLGVQHVDSGDVQGGLALMRKGLALAPEDDILHMNLGRVYLGQDQPNNARFHCDRSIALNPQRDDARECLSLALMMLGDNPGAHKVLAPALRDRMPLSRYILASSVARSNGDFAGARRWLKAAIEVYGEQPALREELGRIPSGR